MFITRNRVENMQVYSSSSQAGSFAPSWSSSPKPEYSFLSKIPVSLNVLRSDSLDIRFAGPGSISSMSSGGTRLNAAQKAKRYIKKKQGKISANALAEKLNLNDSTVRTMKQAFNNPLNLNKRANDIKAVEDWVSKNAEAIYNSRPRGRGNNGLTRHAFFRKEAPNLDSKTVAKMPEEVKNILFSKGTPSASVASSSEVGSTMTSTELHEAGLTTGDLIRAISEFSRNRGKALDERKGRVEKSWLPADRYPKGSGGNSWFLNKLQAHIDKGTDRSIKEDAKHFAADFRKARSLRTPSPEPEIDQEVFDAAMRSYGPGESANVQSQQASAPTQAEQQATGRYSPDRTGRGITYYTDYLTGVRGGPYDINTFEELPGYRAVTRDGFTLLGVYNGHRLERVDPVLGNIWTPVEPEPEEAAASGSKGKGKKK